MRKLSISKNNLRELSYYIVGATLDYHIEKTPSEDLNDLGVNVLAWCPLMMCDTIVILTDYQGELPQYITENKFELHSSFWQDKNINIVK